MEGGLFGVCVLFLTVEGEMARSDYVVVQGPRPGIEIVALDVKLVKRTYMDVVVV